MVLFVLFKYINYRYIRDPMGSRGIYTQTTKKGNINERWSSNDIPTGKNRRNRKVEMNNQNKRAENPRHSYRKKKIGPAMKVTKTRKDNHQLEGRRQKLRNSHRSRVNMKAT